ncbi:putative mitochondrial acyltransferase-like protein, copy 2 [Leptomonas pyrrhocoris]|uniref:Putative mitochondrial acyltransferase-like protein, copy 2 n=1 Tax=Leptomonas pyrrhocoris TaxID=157538 RepID=A0A0N0DSH2_LEPPY|nr:putative mitochondrial acyltransferase-like protein, copy 2 [Leptomonas pyrrhocoris]XP_015654042.1 putative mitochondrial acyltransferase-like protein, copy 2 [Leptomonas pyrrhocoris]XP_015654043.1 putative mitochondrial acyltransferase-like protein, copy 2 [Leptomonas pyrrhocoris]KPA75602.1 putative mitochondrial acyltransferase-like protein, copy 2 [Leptomonas pyrrhocoris]KPA75603.1 putative mitochondrial acyltransferase-like protein, copy 2 [Leptomonas pyrrhocoris]KPA75604.1 putative mit|eukprot:XP_015654041.1 putative mitochondrial acyltransferase-like protein, copy 2 [Leptomonas pyrrhocoris]
MSSAVVRASREAAAQLPRHLSKAQVRGTMLALALGAGYTLLRCRLVPLWIARRWFLLSATAIIMPASALLYLIDPLRYLGVPRRVVQSVCLFIMAFAFKAVCWANPHIRMHVQFDANVDGKPTSWADIPDKGIALTLNHTSFWDVFEVIGLTPMSHLRRTRTLMKASLRKIPIFGGCFDRVGHFPVYFKSDEDGNFHVDKEKQAVVATHVAGHLRRGGNIVVFPEGAVNKNPETLQTFRYGTFATIFEHRMPVYYLVSLGNERTWPAQHPYGGAPADIRVRIGAFPIDFDKENSKVVAARLQQRMQQVRDEMAAEEAEADAAAAQTKKTKTAVDAAQGLQSHAKLPAAGAAAAAA